MTRNHNVLGSGIAASALLFLSAHALAAEALPHRSEPARMPRSAPNAPAPQQETLSAAFDIKGAQHAAFSFTVGAPGKIAVSVQSKGAPVTGSLLTPGGVTVPLNGASPYEYMASADDIKKGGQWKVEVSLAALKSAPRNAVLNSDGHASGDITIVHPAGGNNGRQSVREAPPNANSGSARAAATHVTDQPLPHAPAALAQAGSARRNGEGSSASAGNPNQPQPVSQNADQPQYQPGAQDQGQSQYQQYQPGPQDSGQGQYPQPQTGSQDSGQSQYPKYQSGSQDSGQSQYPQYQSGSQDSGQSQYPQYQQPSQQQPDSPAVQSSLQQQSTQYQQPSYQGQQYQGQQYQGQQYQGQQYQGQQYQGQNQGQQYQGQQYQGQQPAVQQQNQPQPGYSAGAGAPGGSCTVKLSVDRSTINLLDVNTGSERKHLSLGQDRVQKVFTSPDNAWSVAVYKIRGAQQYGFIALELAKCEDQLPVDLPAVPSEARFDQAEVVLTIDKKEKHFPLRNSRMQ